MCYNSVIGVIILNFPGLYEINISFILRFRKGKTVSEWGSLGGLFGHLDSPIPRQSPISFTWELMIYWWNRAVQRYWYSTQGWPPSYYINIPEQLCFKWNCCVQWSVYHSALWASWYTDHWTQQFPLYSQGSLIYHPYYYYYYYYGKKPF